MKAFIVTDLGYGDAGKGSCVDHLCRAYDIGTVIRHNGGAQAAHNVVTDGGKHHTFAQFGSGTFAGAATYLSQYMLVNPLNALVERDALVKKIHRDPFEKTYIHNNCVVITPYQMVMNRIRETIRGAGRHGSTFQGIGETKEDFLIRPDITLFVDDLYSEGLTRAKLQAIKDRQITKCIDLGVDDKHIKQLKEFNFDFDGYMEFYQRATIDDGTFLDNILKTQNVVFEGAQGVLLDEQYGFHPYTTWSDTTSKNAEEILEDYDCEVIKLGLMRSYMTRHGAGPFVTESDNVEFKEEHNGNNPGTGAMRTGYLDLLAYKYAIEITGGIDYLVISHLDVTGDMIIYADSYYDNEHGYYKIPVNLTGDLQLQQKLTNFLFGVKPTLNHGHFKKAVEQLDVKIGIVSRGQRHSNKYNYMKGFM